MQRYTDALTSFNNVLKLNPNDHSARYSLGLVYEKLGQPQKAQAAFELIPSSFALIVICRYIPIVLGGGQLHTSHRVTLLLRDKHRTGGFIKKQVVGLF